MSRMTGALWWIDRWRQSTAYTDMPAELQGLYRNLCDEVWVREDGIIPDDPRTLSKVSGDPEAWGRVGDKVLAWMIKVEGRGWTNATALEVKQESQRRAERQAAYRARKRGEGNGGASGTPAHSESNAAHNHRHNGGDNKHRPPSPSPSPELRRNENNDPPIPPARAGGRAKVERDRQNRTAPATTTERVLREQVEKLRTYGVSVGEVMHRSVLRRLRERLRAGLTPAELRAAIKAGEFRPRPRI